MPAECDSLFILFYFYSVYVHLSLQNPMYSSTILTIYTTCCMKLRHDEESLTGTPTSCIYAETSSREGHRHLRASGYEEGVFLVVLAVYPPYSADGPS